MFDPYRSAAALLLAVALPTAVLAAGPAGFDDPLAELARYDATGLELAISGVGTSEGQRTFDIDVPGEPVAAWLYWSGETNAAGLPDPWVLVEGGALAAATPLFGTESGRRHVIFGDESQGGEVVARAEFPLDGFASGLNTFTVSEFNENREFYVRTFGVLMLVVYRNAGSTTLTGAEVQDGADVANHYRYHRMPGYESQAASEPVCFVFTPRSADVTGQLAFGVGGTLEISRGSGERTWIATGTGALPTSLIGTGALLEVNELIDPAFSWLGWKIAAREDEVVVPAGHDWLCIQVEPTPATGSELPQNLVVEAAALVLPEPPTGEGCLTRTGGFWSTHPAMAERYAPVTSCGLELTTALAATEGSTSEDLCFGGRDHKAAGSPQQMQLIRQCAAAALNLAATADGGGSCGADTAALLDRCCADLCTDGLSGSAIRASGCIEEVTAFNESLDTLAPFGPWLEGGQGPAETAQCRAARNNGFINARPFLPASEPDRPGQGNGKGDGKDKNKDNGKGRGGKNR